MFSVGQVVGSPAGGQMWLRKELLLAEREGCMVSSLCQLCAFPGPLSGDLHLGEKSSHTHSCLDWWDLWPPELWDRKPEWPVVSL